MRPINILLTLAMCAAPAFCGSITLTGTVRDFLYSCTPQDLYNGLPGQGHPDFENVVASDWGVVKTTLGADGTPVYASSGSTVSTHGATFFNMWYHDTPGYNASMAYSITAGETSPGSGIYSYSNTAFFPIDGQLFGNQGDSHNYSFTFQLPTTFTYQPGQTFTFSGDDDVWVFINNKLVIDLGGVHGEDRASVNLDTLGLTAGNQYHLDLFFAERHTSASTLRFETSIPFESSPVPEPGTAALALTGFGGLLAAVLRRRRRGGPQR
jgi:fibro-slime domain-containing protein